MGHIGKHLVSILIDSGSTHNFIQDRVAKLLGLPHNQVQSFQVLVGNGEELKCESICEQVQLSLGDHQVMVDLFSLPSGAELVIGIQWLRTLGPVLTDYNNLTMKFMNKDQAVHLQGVPKAPSSESSLHQLRRMVHTQAIDSVFQLHILEYPLIIPPN